MASLGQVYATRCEEEGFGGIIYGLDKYTSEEEEENIAHDDHAKSLGTKFMLAFFYFLFFFTFFLPLCRRFFDSSTVFGTYNFCSFVYSGILIHALWISIYEGSEVKEEKKDGDQKKVPA